MKLLILTIATVTALAAPAKAKEGNEGGGGGDTCEARIQSIRDDLTAWIGKGGHQTLTLPASISIEQYAKSMTDAADSAKIRCVHPGDKGYPVEVNGTAKECRFDRKGAKMLITCDSQKFSALGETEQYQLIHHEYAGLANIETPSGDISQYTVSKQISSYLVDTVVKRLAVRSAPSSGQPAEQLNNAKGAGVSQALMNSLDETEFSDCSKKIEPPTASQQLTCEGEPYWYIRYSMVPHKSSNKNVGANNVTNYFSCPEKPTDTRGTWLSIYEDGGLHVVRYLSLWNFQINPGERDDLETLFYINPSDNKIKKVTFNAQRRVEKNFGTITQPNFKKVRETVWTFTCNAK